MALPEKLAPTQKNFFSLVDKPIPAQEQAANYSETDLPQFKKRVEVRMETDNTTYIQARDTIINEDLRDNYDSPYWDRY